MKNHRKQQKFKLILVEFFPLFGSYSADKELVLEEFHDYLDIFSEEKAHQFLDVIITVATDMAVTSKHAIDAERFKSHIRKFWEIIDHGPIKWFLGFKIKRDHDTRTLGILCNHSVICDACCT